MSKRSLVLAVPALLAAVSPALGDSIANAPPQSRWIAFVIAGVLFAAILAASIMSSKRTHQD